MVVDCVVEMSRSDSVVAFERAVYATKSFVIGLALCKGRLTADNAADASHVEVRAQIELWGEVEDSEWESALTFLRSVLTFDSPRCRLSGYSEGAG
jgi:chaperone required for assembly of F1-ATPase